MTTSPISPLAIGDEAPNFDLSSTENALLMLRDEIIQNAVVLYFFAAESERTVRDLLALHGALDPLARLRARVLGVSPVKLDDLKKLQAARHLLFPLLHDDRDFTAKYGVIPEVSAPGEAGASPPAPPALVVVSRKQRVLWLANPVTAVADALPQIRKLLKNLPSPTTSYPKSIVNRVVDFWVN